MILSKINRVVLSIITILLISCNNSSNEGSDRSPKSLINTDSIMPDTVQQEPVHPKPATIPNVAYIETKTKKFGMVDDLGRILVDTIYDDNWLASLDKEKGQAMFKKGAYFLLINYKNEIVIDLTGYSGHTNSFIRDKMPARDEKSGMSGYLGRGGVVMLPFVFEHTNPFEKHLPLATASINGKWGVIDEEGNWVLQAKYPHVYKIVSESSFIVLIEDGGDYYYVDNKGNVGEKVEVGG